MNLLKDKKIILYRKQNIKDKEGFTSTKYVAYTGRVWAYVRQLSASEYYAAQALQQKEEMLFAVNWRPDVAPADCVAYKGVFYNITRVDTFEGYKDDLKLYGARLATQPKPGDVVELQG